MEGLLIVDKGLESTALTELEELIQAKGVILEPGLVGFSCKNVKELCVLCYKAQSVQRVLLLLGKAACRPDLESIHVAGEKLVKGVAWKDWLPKGKAFCCSAEHFVETKFTSMDLAREVGSVVFDRLAGLKLNPKVSLKSPDVRVNIVLGAQLYLSVDFGGRDLSKRAYKIYHHASALKGTVAYGLVRFSRFKSSERLVDPFCGSGMIPIEAALYAEGWSPHHFAQDFAFQKLCPQKLAFFKKLDAPRKNSAPSIFGSDHLLPNVKASQNNAKIAGVQVTFSKSDVEWLDTQFTRHTVDRIVTHPPESSKRVDEKSIAKVYREFFYQADFVLKKNGIITVLLTKKDLLVKLAKEKGFGVEAEQEVWSGKMKYVMIRLKREDKSGLHTLNETNS